MVVKINNKPIRVEEKEDDKTFGKMYWVVSGLGYLLLFWVLDYAAAIFVGTHPFPIFQYVGVVLKWLGLI